MTLTGSRERDHESSCLWRGGPAWIDRSRDFLQSRRVVAGVAALASATGHWGIVLAAIAALEPLPTLEPSRTATRTMIATAWLIETPRIDASGFVASAEPPPLMSEAITIPPPELPEIEAVGTGAFEATDAVQDMADVAELERLQGIYRGQVHARIERLLDADWPLRPIWPRCRARVIQDEAGRVLDVDLDECQVDEGTYGELARIIRASSPLPLPPEGLAMGSYLTLDLSTL